MTRAEAPLRVRFVAAIVALAITLVLAAASAHAAQPSNTVADPVLVWNDQTNVAIQTTSTDPFLASRALALESIAVLDTVRSIAGVPAFLVRLPRPPDVKAGTAAAAAAHAMLCHLFPARRDALDGALANSLANEPAGAARDRAVAFGKAVADAVFAVRDRDGWDAPAHTNVGAVPGIWRPTPPDHRPPMVPQWAYLTPFVLSGPSQFRPAGPPSPGSTAFHDAVAFVASIGAVNSAARKPAQTEIAHYWSDAIGTYAPAGHWNAIAASQVAPLGLGINDEAELFAELNIAIADAGIAIADAKYAYWFWRPITAIHAGGPGSKPMPDWEPLLATPNHPSYISGHSGFSGAAAVILTARLGARPFSFVSASLPGVTRSFASFDQAAEEAAMSRVYGGIHYSFDNADGLVTGRLVGTWTLAAFRRIAEDRGPVIVLDRPTDLEESRTRGFALDNYSPVAEVTARFGDGEAFSVPVDHRGRFTLPRQSPGQRQLMLIATSTTGRTAMVPVGMRGDGAVTIPVTVR